MKKLILTVASVLLATLINAQTPDSFNYQAVARDADGIVIGKQSLGLQITILNGDTAVYVESHKVETSEFGLFTLSIGDGVASLGDFSTIDWATGDYGLSLGMDENGGVAYTTMGTTKLVAVPYAMHAKTAENVFSGDYNDLINRPEVGGGEEKAATDPWLQGGNGGTTNGVDFVGTTDEQDLDFALNKVVHFRMTQKGQLEVRNTGNSIFIGSAAGENDDMWLNFNVFVGHYSGNQNTGGTLNTAVGASSLEKNTTGKQNIAIGAFAMQKNKTGGNNIAVGFSALTKNETGNQNTAVGAAALLSNKSGDANVAIGNNTLYHNTSGIRNTATGKTALYENITGNSNTANGYEAMFQNSGGDLNTAIGMVALRENIGGDENTAVGAYALHGSYDASQCTAVGFDALKSTQADGNTAVGYKALLTNQYGVENTVVGAQAMRNNYIGQHNAAVGAWSLFNSTSAEQNSALGTYAMFNNISGIRNVAVGWNSGFNIETESNAIAVGYNAPSWGSNTAIIGNIAMTTIGGFQDWTNVSDGRFKVNVTENVSGLDFIMKLRPVTYNLDMDAIADFYDMPDSTRMKSAERTKGAELQVGFIAQEVEVAASEANFDFHGVDAPKNDQGHYGLRYAEFVPPLVKAVQEQQATIDAQKQLIDDLMNRLEALESEN